MSHHPQGTGGMGLLSWLFGEPEASAADPPSRLAPVQRVTAREAGPTEQIPAAIARVVSIRGVGERTARNLSAAGFGSVEAIASATEKDLLAVPGVGPTTAARLKAYAAGDPIPVTSPERARLNPDGQPTPAFNASRRIDRGIHEMLGLCRGILADGVVSADEALLLMNWMESNPDLTQQWPASALAERLDRIFADGVVEPDEQEDLAELLREISGVIEGGEQAVGQSTTLPLDRPPPPLQFSGWEYVFTGRFASGTRRWCQQAVERGGAACASDVTLRTNVLVVGTYGSRDWAHSSYGRKIEKAVEYRRKTDIVIVDEAHWSSFL